MEIQLNELIDQIKKEGVEAAENEAAEIISSAKAEAEKIILNAKAKAQKITLDAKQDAERTLRVSEDAIRQAGRNLLISFRESVNKELDVILSESVAKTYSSEIFTGIIIKAVEALSQNPEAEDISVILNSDDLKELESTLLSELKNKMLTGVTLKPNDNFDGGFRISVKEGGAYYDYSAASVTEMLSAYLSPKVTALLKEAL